MFRPNNTPTHPNNQRHTEGFRWLTAGLFGLIVLSSGMGCCSETSSLRGSFFVPTASRQSRLARTAMAFMELSENIECDRTFPLFSKVARRSPSPQLFDRAYKEAGLQLARCGQWHALFSSLLPRDLALVDSTLDQLKHLGHPVAKHFLRWLSSHRHWRRPQRLSVAYWEQHKDDHKLAKQLLQWLLKTPLPTTLCASLSDATRGLMSPVSREFMLFFERASCPNTLPLLRTQLGHNNALNRIQACILLGKMGKFEDLIYLKKLGLHDNLYLQSRGMLEYPVRIACTNAFSRLKKKIHQATRLTLSPEAISGNPSSSGDEAILP